MEFKDTFWSQLLAVFFMILCLPLLPFLILISAIVQEIECFRERRRYKKSSYYLNFGVRYLAGVTDTPVYRFYESALSRGLLTQYHHLSAQNMDLFLYEDCVYFLPDFDSVYMDDEDGQWVVDRDGDVRGVEEEMAILCASLEGFQSLPKKILVERKMISMDDLQAVALPEQICLVETYESAFGEEAL